MTDPVYFTSQRELHAELTQLNKEIQELEPWVRLYEQMLRRKQELRDEYLRLETPTTSVRVRKVRVKAPQAQVRTEADRALAKLTSEQKARLFARLLGQAA